MPIKRKPTSTDSLMVLARPIIALSNFNIFLARDYDLYMRISSTIIAKNTKAERKEEKDAAISRRSIVIGLRRNGEREIKCLPICWIIVFEGNIELSKNRSNYLFKKCMKLFKNCSALKVQRKKFNILRRKVCNVRIM